MRTPRASSPLSEVVVKRFLTVVVILGCAVGVSAQGRQGGGARQGGGGDSQGGVGAIGQSVPLVAAPTGPTPHFPDGTVDLSGVWVGGGSVNDKIGRAHV